MFITFILGMFVGGFIFFLYLKLIMMEEEENNRD